MRTPTIAHATIEVRHPQRFRTWLDTLTDGNARMAADEPQATGALRITEGPRDDLVALGIDYPDDATLDAALDQLARAGHACEEVAGEAHRTIRCCDPLGTEIDLRVAPPGVAASDARWPVNHVAFAADDPSRIEAFYELLGFRCNERIATRIGPLDVNGSFLGSARQHHAVAALNIPTLRRLHHLCLDTGDVANVVERWHQAKTARLPLANDLGRHPLPDGTTSFYALSPAGFDVELGAGGNVLDGSELLAPVQSDTPSSWGHGPGPRAVLRLLSAMLRRALPGGKKRARPGSRLALQAVAAPVRPDPAAAGDALAGEAPSPMP